jgi:2-amino-4-hydroxy-6-hydroxymethyldihydropteridine diphosphokinase
MTDHIHVRDLLLRGVVGINPEEREKRQDILINLILHADTQPAGLTDRIEDAVNYKTITKRVIRMVENSQFFLVERLVDEVALICLADSRVEAVRATVEKPGALRFSRSVGVEIYRTREEIEARPHRVFVAMGSNIEPEKNLRRAVALLSERVDLVDVSSVYETAPVGKEDQASFLNAAVVIRTSHSAAVLKREVLSGIEQVLGRVRTEDKNAPRTIDLDIALFDYDVLAVGSRRIPDPDIETYPHLAVPLADVAPYYVHPESGRALREIADSLPSGDVKRLPTHKLWRSSNGQ